MCAMLCLRATRCFVSSSRCALSSAHCSASGAWAALLRKNEAVLAASCETSAAVLPTAACFSLPSPCPCSCSWSDGLLGSCLTRGSQRLAVRASSATDFVVNTDHKACNLAPPNRQSPKMDEGDGEARKDCKAKGGEQMLKILSLNLLTSHPPIHSHSPIHSHTHTQTFIHSYIHTHAHTNTHCPLNASSPSSHTCGAAKCRPAAGSKLNAIQLQLSKLPQHPVRQRPKAL